MKVHSTYSLRAPARGVAQELESHWIIIYVPVVVGLIEKPLVVEPHPRVAHIRRRFS